VTEPLPEAPVLAPPPDQGPRRKPRRSHRRSRRKALVAVLLALAALGGMGTVAVVGVDRIYDRFAENTADYPGPGFGEVRFQISLGNAIRTIGANLVAAGVVETEGAFVAAARDEPKAATLQPGFYRLKKEMKAADALALLIDPSSRILNRAAIPEGRNVDETLAVFSRDSGIPVEQFRSALKDMKALGFPAWAKNQPEGFLFPATYDIEPDATATSILKDVAKRFDRALNETELVSKAPVVGMTPLEVLTVASIIEEEVRLAEDFGKVSRVIQNRLDRPMRLQMDSTVRYITGKKAITTTGEDRAIDSPYNTYLKDGLPPGPISSPGRAAIEAALNPTPGPWIYFVAVNPTTGQTKFAVTPAEHSRNVAEFRKWLASNPQ
jgi:UPF0755 protein